MADLENTPCPIDGHGTSSEWLWANDVEFGGTERFRIVRCARCGLRYLDPRPTANAIAQYYPAAYYTHVARGVEEDAKTYAVPHTLVRQYGRPGRLLDVGAGDGAFLALLMRDGWTSVEGIEPDPVAADIARESRNLAVRHGALPVTPLQAGAYATITMLEVLEHLHEPREALLSVHTALEPGGRLILTTPNVDGLEFRLLGPRSISLQVPRHLAFYNRASMIFALDYAGFEVLSVVTSHSTSGLTRSLWMTVRRGLTSDGEVPPGSVESEKRQPMSWRRRTHRIVDQMLHPVGLVAARAGWGPTLLVVATPR